MQFVNTEATSFYTSRTWINNDLPLISKEFMYGKNLFLFAQSCTHSSNLTCSLEVAVKCPLIGQLHWLKFCVCNGINYAFLTAIDFGVIVPKLRCPPEFTFPPKT
jgi:hypothetical protein